MFNCSICSKEIEPEKTEINGTEGRKCPECGYEWILLGEQKALL